jgi:F-type H+-transporting ATPase subunit gamma
MAQLKEVKMKISAVKKTKQITKAMNMVAASKLRGAQQNMEAFRPYANKFAEVLDSLVEKSGEGASPLTVPRSEVKKVNIIVCTSDRGLCGGFNANLVTRADKFSKELKEKDIQISFVTFGKKGREWCRKTSNTILSEHIGIIGSRIGFHVSSHVGQTMVDQFLKGTVDEVYVIFPEFRTVSKQTPVIRQILPIIPEKSEKTEMDSNQPYLAEHICEPSSDELLGDLMPTHVHVQIHRALLETSASEHAARMVAMDNATKACNDMIGSLTLAYNKARQSAITADLMDIVGGAEALKG